LTTVGAIDHNDPGFEPVDTNRFGMLYASG
jgi:hypothetical protein